MSPGAGARLFVAVDVGDTVRREVTRVVTTLTGKLEAARTPPKVVWVKPASLHVTIRFIGEVDETEVARLQELMSRPIDVAPFDIEWRGIGAFPSHRHPRALWLGVINGAAPLALIEAEVSRRLAAAAPIELDGRALLPHLTLGRIKMAGAGVDWPKLLQSVEVKRATSRIDRVTLYRSELSRGGPHYTGLASAPLNGSLRTND